MPGDAIFSIKVLVSCSERNTKNRETTKQNITSSPRSGTPQRSDGNRFINGSKTPKRSMWMYGTLMTPTWITSVGDFSYIFVVCFHEVLYHKYIHIYPWDSVHPNMIFVNDNRNLGTSTTGFDFHVRLMAVYLGMLHETKLCIPLTLVPPMWQGWCLMMQPFYIPFRRKMMSQFMMHTIDISWPYGYIWENMSTTYLFQSISVHTHYFHKTHLGVNRHV